MSSLELCNHVQCTQPGVFEFIDTIGTMCNTHKMQGMLKVRKFNVYEQARILKELQVARKKKTCSNANLITLVQTKFKLVPSRHDLKNWQQSFSQQDIKNALKAKKLAISEKRVTVSEGDLSCFHPRQIEWIYQSDRGLLRSDLEGNEQWSFHQLVSSGACMGVDGKSG